MRLTPSRFAQALPVDESLRWLRANRVRSPDKMLTHVTSEALCDDTLDRLRPTLPAPHTCDLIDINPGICLWSQRLHEAIRPRRHILVERNFSLFAPFINRLLKLQNSPYRFAPSLDAALNPEARLLSQDVYNFRKFTAQRGGSDFSINPHLLMTANLSGKARKAAGFVGSQAKQFLNDQYRATFIKENYAHRYGLVRLLAWIADDARQAVVPTSVHNRTKQSIQLESAFHLDTVTAPSLQGLSPHQIRWFHLDMENSKEVRKHQEQLGIHVPLGREQPEPVPDFSSMKADVQVIRENKHLYPDHQIFIQRLLELDERVSSQDPEWYEKYHVESKEGFLRGRRKVAKDKEIQKDRSLFRALHTEFRTQHNTYHKSMDFIWESRQLFFKLKRAWIDGWFSQPLDSPNNPHRAKVQKLTMEDNFLQERRKDLKRDTRSLVTKTIDDYQSFDTTPPTTVWNRRRTDPLLARKDEFYPPSQTMSLFDMTPNPSLQDKLDTVDKQICFDYVCTQLMTNPSDPVLRAIKRIVPGGEDQFLERVPELRDIARGGWWNLDNVRVRTLHSDHFVAIALAFHGWPHRPTIQTLMASYKGVFDKGPV